MDGFITNKSRGTKIKNTINNVFCVISLNKSIMQQKNKGVNKSTCISIMLICVKFIHSVEQRKSGKASLVCQSSIKDEEQTFNLIKVGISCLSDMFLKLPKTLEFFFLYQYFDLDDSIHPLPMPIGKK